MFIQDKKMMCPVEATDAPLLECKLDCPKGWCRIERLIAEDDEESYPKKPIEEKH